MNNLSFAGASVRVAVLCLVLPVIAGAQHASHEWSYNGTEGPKEWGKLDPITRLETRMIEEGWATPTEVDGMRASIRSEVDEAVAWAENSPYPNAATLLENVYES